MNDCGVEGPEEIDDKDDGKRTVIVKKDKTFYIPTISFADKAYYRHKEEWPEFAKISETIKNVIVEAVRDTSSAYKELRYINTPLDEYKKNVQGTSSKADEELPF